MDCGKNYCSSQYAAWQWYQGGTTGTLLGSGSLSTPCCTLTKSVRGTTTQPAAADTVAIQLKAGECGKQDVFSFTPGSAINITDKIAINISGTNYVHCYNKFTMKS